MMITTTTLCDNFYNISDFLNFNTILYMELEPEALNTHAKISQECHEWMLTLMQECMCFVSRHESVPEGDAAVPYDDSNSAGNVGTAACNTWPGRNHVEGS